MRSVYIAGLAFFSTALVAQNAADQYFDPEEMAKARKVLKASHGAQVNSLILGERFEFHSNHGDPLAVWEGQGWIGNDEKKFWIKTEGEYAHEDSRFEEAEIQALYSRAISPFWDVQAGLRFDLEPDPSRSYLALGVQGLAPQWFELDTQLFLSDEGDISARIEVEYALRLTQRLILQPRVELNAAFSDDPEIGVGSGFSSVDAGLRLRYEVRREFAPYIGISWIRALGNTEDFVAAAGEDSSELSLVVGIRLWY